MIIFTIISLGVKTAFYTTKILKNGYDYYTFWKFLKKLPSNTKYYLRQKLV